jgi:hypothetical protein
VNATLNETQVKRWRFPSVMEIHGETQSTSYRKHCKAIDKVQIGRGTSTTALADALRALTKVECSLHLMSPMTVKQSKMFKKELGVTNSRIVNKFKY